MDTLRVVRGCACYDIRTSTSSSARLSEAGRREVVHSRISDEAPVGIIFDARQGHVRSSWHVRDVEPERDVCKCGALHFVVQNVTQFYESKHLGPSGNGELTSRVLFHK